MHLGSTMQQKIGQHLWRKKLHLGKSHYSHDSCAQFLWKNGVFRSQHCTSLLPMLACAGFCRGWIHQAAKFNDITVSAHECYGWLSSPMGHFLFQTCHGQGPRPTPALSFANRSWTTRWVQIKEQKLQRLHCEFAIKHSWSIWPRQEWIISITVSQCILLGQQVQESCDARAFKLTSTIHSKPDFPVALFWAKCGRVRYPPRIIF